MVWDGIEMFGYLNNESLFWFEMEVEFFLDLLKFLINVYFILIWWKVVRMDEFFDYRGSLYQMLYDKIIQFCFDEQCDYESVCDIGNVK